MWDDAPINVTQEANFIWSIANKLRGSYMPDKYGDVIIPMTIIRRFECALAKTKAQVVAQYKENPDFPPKAYYKISGYQFYFRKMCAVCFPNWTLQSTLTRWKRTGVFIRLSRPFPSWI